MPYAIAHALNGDTIDFDPTLTNGTPITLTSTLTIATDLTIIGNGVANTIISGGGLIQDIKVTSAVTASTISGVTIENGVIAGYGASGGDIANAGTLTLVDSHDQRRQAARVGRRHLQHAAR